MVHFFLLATAACPGSTVCSGHGRCVSMKQMASEPNAAPFGGSYSYGGSPLSTTWDEDKIYGCVCDSGWEVRSRNDECGQRGAN